MSESTVLYDVDEQIATITLNRPERLNAITRELEDELRAAMERAEEDEGVRVIILTGAGRGFCAGADMELLEEVGQVDWSTVDMQEAQEKIVPAKPRDGVAEGFQKTYSYFPAISKPILGAINGAAVGLGFVLPLYCDIRFASDKARFGTAFSQRGLIAEHGVSWMLPRLIGISGAFDLLYSARLIDASEALSLGLVSRVIPHDQLLEEVTAYARQLATSVSPRSLRVMKRQVYEALFQSLGEATDVANDEMIESFQCQDFQEGVAHFLEKRPAAFTGR
jgi:enoyl-CoA hydratase/carnithine racemase